MTAPRDLTPQDCPRYDRCSANVCPMDVQWRKRSHVRGDEVCFFLTESVKPNADANFASLAVGWVLEVVTPVLTDPALPRDITAALERARLSGSKIVNQRAAGERLKARHKASNDA